MVERLAKRWPDEWTTDTSDKDAIARSDARWWLNAIADELDATRPMEKWSGWDWAIATLRTQATENTDG